MKATRQSTYYGSKCVTSLVKSKVIPLLWRAPHERVHTIDVNVLPTILKIRVIPLLCRAPHERVCTMEVNVLPSIIKSRVILLLW